MRTKTSLLIALLPLFLLSAGRISAFYDPGVQRWLNRDPIWSYPQVVRGVSRMTQSVARARGRMLDMLGEANLYEFVENEPLSNIDPLGLGANDPPPCAPYPECLKNMPPRNPTKPPPYWYQCVACSATACQNLNYKVYQGCENACVFSCMRVAIVGGPAAAAICVGDCLAGCALRWTIGEGLCQLCINP